MKRKVLFLIDSLQTGGAEKSILEVSKRFKNITPIICVLYSDKDDLRASCNKAKIKIIDLNLKRRNYLWWLNGKFLFNEVIKEVSPDIIHANLFKSEIISRLTKKSTTPFVLGSFVSDSYSTIRIKNLSYFNRLKLKIVKFFDKLTSKRVDRFISITEAIKRSNSKALNISLDKIIVINRGRSLKEFPFVKRTFPVENELFRFILIGRTIKSKGYYDVLDAIKVFRKKTKKNFEVIVVGDGPEFICLQEKAKKLDVNVKFLGRRGDISDLLSESHCFIFASHFEGQGGALIEAMLSGIPIIASDIDVFKEQVGDNYSAKFFKIKNSVDLADKMKWMMENYNDALKLGQNARLEAIQKYDIEIIADKTEEFYLSLIH